MADGHYNQGTIPPHTMFLTHFHTMILPLLSVALGDTKLRKPQEGEAWNCYSIKSPTTHLSLSFSYTELKEKGGR